MKCVVGTRNNVLDLTCNIEHVTCIDYPSLPFIACAFLTPLDSPALSPLVSPLALFCLFSPPLLRLLLPLLPLLPLPHLLVDMETRCGNRRSTMRCYVP